VRLSDLLSCYEIWNLHGFI